MTEVLDSLAALARRRADLDRSERRLITAARAGGATWGQVAAALGLRSRQAAEQRWLRLAAASTHPAASVSGPPPQARARRREQAGSGVNGELAGAELRAQISVLHDRLAPFGCERGTSAGVTDLARSTLALAADAPLGPLHDLTRKALDDLRGMPPGTLGTAVEAAVARLGASVGVPAVDNPEAPRIT